MYKNISKCFCEILTKSKYFSSSVTSPQIVPKSLNIVTPNFLVVRVYYFSRSKGLCGASYECYSTSSCGPKDISNSLVQCKSKHTEGDCTPIPTQSKQISYFTHPFIPPIPNDTSAFHKSSQTCPEF